MVNQETIWIKDLLVVLSMILTINSITFSFVSLVKKWEMSITQRFKEKSKPDQFIWMTTKPYPENSSNISKEQAEQMIHISDESKDHWTRK